MYNIQFIDDATIFFIIFIALFVRYGLRFVMGFIRDYKSRRKESLIELRKKYYILVAKNEELNIEIKKIEQDFNYINTEICIDEKNVQFIMKLRDKKYEVQTLIAEKYQLYINQYIIDKKVAQFVQILKEKESFEQSLDKCLDAVSDRTK